MENRQTKAVGRFAPSPTGPLHTGSLVAAVGSYLFAKSQGGRWLIRMEDIDTPRVVPGVADEMLKVLETLGFEWDGEVLYQSRRQLIYLEAIEKLKKGGWLYPCGCTRSELKMAASAPHAGDEGPPYSGTCRSGLPPGKTARALRVLTDDFEPLTFEDRVLGPLSCRFPEIGGDFVVLRADGVVAYQLAVVVDDALSGVTEVVRGSDLLTSTPRQIHLQRLLGLPTPAYAHLPLVTGPGGAKLSKRDNAVRLEEPGALEKSSGQLIKDALTFLGQNPPGDLLRLTGREALAWGLQNFSLEKLKKNESGDFFHGNYFTKTKL